VGRSAGGSGVGRGEEGEAATEEVRTGGGVPVAVGSAEERSVMRRRGGDEDGAAAQREMRRGGGAPARVASGERLEAGFGPAGERERRDLAWPESGSAPVPLPVPARPGTEQEAAAAIGMGGGGDACENR